MGADSKPFGKAHSRLVANEYLRLGWTLLKEFYVDGDDEPCEWIFEWDHPEEPKRPEQN